MTCPLSCRRSVAGREPAFQSCALSARPQCFQLTSRAARHLTVHVSMCYVCSRLHWSTTASRCLLCTGQRPTVCSPSTFHAPPLFQHFQRNLFCLRSIYATVFFQDQQLSNAIGNFHLDGDGRSFLSAKIKKINK